LKAGYGGSGVECCEDMAGFGGKRMNHCNQQRSERLWWDKNAHFQLFDPLREVLYFCGKYQFTLEVQHIIQSLRRVEAFSTTTFPPPKRQMLCQTQLQFL
jgi:hypothetical protein